MTIGGQPVVFITKVEHVGVIRNTAGNMSYIMNMISANKSSTNFVLSVGLARGHSSNPAVSLKAPRASIASSEVPHHVHASLSPAF